MILEIMQLLLFIECAYDRSHATLCRRHSLSHIPLVIQEACGLMSGSYAMGLNMVLSEFFSVLIVYLEVTSSEGP